MDIVTYALLKSRINKISPSPYKYKGSVETQSDLPSSADIGDMYSVNDTGKSYVWDGTQWNEVSSGGSDTSPEEYIAHIYSSSSTYAKGSYVIYGDNLYKAVTDITVAEEWDLSHWEQVWVTDDIISLRPVTKDITLSAEWAGSGPYTHSVTISDYDVTENTKVDLSADNSVISTLVNDGVDSIYINNTNGVLTAYAIGAKPSASITVTAILTEVR